ncbi:AMP-binding protein [Streptomyces sp. NPDC056670]|uniref:AMP-binding protein n=1 Tax=Streptomyces sp. NPDC056670 TaxID=3345904 RepID=UPI0036BBE4CA
MTGTSYVDDLLDALTRHPNRPALITHEGRHIPAGDVRDGVHRAAAGLAALGIGRGDTVTLLTGNGPDALVARYAANLLGARVVFLGPGLAVPAQAEIVSSVDTAILLVDPALRGQTEVLLRKTQVPLVHTLTELAAHTAGHAPGPVTSGARPEDDWCIRHTGGTTGIPKGLRMAHGPYRDLLARSAARLEASERPRLLACTSLAHMAGILADIALLAGGSVVLRDAFEPGDALATIDRERITDLWLLPPLLYELLDHPRLTLSDVTTVRRIVYGGTPVAAGRLVQAQEAFGPVLHGSYGQTEAGCITELLPHEHHGGEVTVGRAAPGVDIEIRDPAGTVLEAGATGEIHVRTPLMMSGYWQQPELTAEVLVDGWIRTGDVGHLDAEGRLHLVDQLKELVIVVGGHVYPAELEQLLLTHPDIAQCAAFGVRDPQGVEHVHVAVVPATLPRSVRYIGNTVRDLITSHKGALYAPEAVHVVDRVPLTHAGKPDKRRLRASLGLA